MTPDPDSVRVPLEAPLAPYDVLVGAGLLDAVPGLLRERLPAQRYAIITDRTVASLYGTPLERLLRGNGLAVDLFAFPAGETFKTRATWAELTDRMLDAGFGRDSAVIAVGGGVAADLAGFVAGTYMRGLPLLQVPTSLLAMVDASVGGKCGVDTPAGKNLVGVFHQPALVVADVATLRSLPDAELRSGLAECIKHGAIADAQYLDWLGSSIRMLLSGDTEHLARAVVRSVEIKARIVALDVGEAGPRAALNFGHTIGHALEAATSYSLSHGEAVALGMLAEAVAGEAAGVTEPGTAAALEVALRSAGLPTALPTGVDLADAVAFLGMDKKARAGRPRFTLLERIGTVARGAGGEWTLPLDEGVVRAALDRLSP